VTLEPFSMLFRAGDSCTRPPVCVCVCVCVCGGDDDDDDDDVLQVNKCMAYSLRIEARDIVPCSDFTIDGFGCFASDLQQVCMYACTYALWVD